MPEEVKNSELETYLKSLLGNQYAAFLSAAAEPTSIRTNTLKTSSRHIRHLLKKFQYNTNIISFNPDGFTLKSDHLPLSHSLAFFEGLFQYQGLSSQIPALILNIQPGDRVLDMAAAPGSKSGQLAAILNQTGFLVLNDSSYHRLQALQAIMQRSGAINHYILNHRGENLSRIFPAYFDKILLDAPCTALGTYFSTSERYNWWSAKKLDKLSKLQYQLVVSSIKCLKKGGEMVYSTCSISPEENEFIIEKIIKKYPVCVEDISQKFHSDFENDWTSIHDSAIPGHMEKSIRLWPHIHAMEGFFIVKLKKTANLKEETNPSEMIPTLSSYHPKITPVLEQLSKSWGVDLAIWKKYNFLLTKNRIWMMSQGIEQVPKENFISAGLLLAEKRINGWKLVNGSAQYLSQHITNRRLTLSDPEIKTLFREGNVMYKDLPEDYYALDYEGRVIGSIFHERGLLRMRLPHLFTRIAL